MNPTRAQRWRSWVKTLKSLQTPPHAIVQVEFDEDGDIAAETPWALDGLDPDAAPADNVETIAHFPDRDVPAKFTRKFTPSPGAPGGRAGKAEITGIVDLTKVGIETLREELVAVRAERDRQQTIIADLQMQLLDARKMSMELATTSQTSLAQQQEIAFKRDALAKAEQVLPQLIEVARMGFGARDLRAEAKLLGADLQWILQSAMMRPEVAEQLNGLGNSDPRFAQAMQRVMGFIQVSARM